MSSTSFGSSRTMRPRSPRPTSRLPSIRTVVSAFPGAQVRTVLSPGIAPTAFWPRSGADPRRISIPRSAEDISLAPISKIATDRAVRRLSMDLADGTWDLRYGHLRSVVAHDVGLRLIVGPEPTYRHLRPPDGMIYPQAGNCGAAAGRRSQEERGGPCGGVVCRVVGGRPAGRLPGAGTGPGGRGATGGRFRRSGAPGQRLGRRGLADRRHAR